MKWTKGIQDGAEVWKCGAFLIERIGLRQRYRCYVMEYQVGAPEDSLKGAQEWCEEIKAAVVASESGDGK